MKQTIALVDDDRNILTSVSMTLEQEGYTVRTFTDGESALQGLTAKPADLAVLAAPPERYGRYVAAVREEYRHVSDTDWRTGRAAVLTDLLAGGVYRTATALSWEDQARDNMWRELRRLQA